MNKGAGIIPAPLSFIAICQNIPKTVKNLPNNVRAYMIYY